MDTKRRLCEIQKYSSQIYHHQKHTIIDHLQEAVANLIGTTSLYERAQTAMSLTTDANPTNKSGRSVNIPLPPNDV